MIKIDMSEFMERHNVSRLVGAPAGYVGYDDGGKLTEAVRRKPYSIILFDEIEKAHPEVFNILLQILEDGYLTDAKGRRVNFRNTIIIMTSNIGVNELTHSAALGFRVENNDDPAGTQFGAPENSNYEKMKRVVLEQVKKKFNPEFLNRIDETIVFKSLGADQISGIVKIQLDAVLKRMAERKIQPTFTDKLVSYLAKRGYDPLYGGRPLKRLIQNEVLNPLAKKIIAGEIKNGDKFVIDATDSGVVFNI